MIKITTSDKSDSTEKGSFASALKGKTLYIDKGLYEQARKFITELGIKRLTGTLVSSDPEQAAKSVLFYKNFNNLNFSVPGLRDKTNEFIRSIGMSLIANIPKSNLYIWGDVEHGEHTLSFPYSTEVETCLSEIAYLCQCYKDIDYNQTIVTSFGATTRFIFGRIYEQLDRDLSSKTLNIDPSFYKDLEKLTGLQGTSATIRGLVWIASLIYFILKNKEGKLVDYLSYLKTEKSVNIARIRRPIATMKSQRINLLHEWNVVCSATELEILLGDDWSDLMKRQRKTLNEIRRGRDKSTDLNSLEEDIKERSENKERSVIYARQRRLHQFMRTKQEAVLKNQRGDEKRSTITPTKSEWRSHCISTGDKSALCELTIPLLEWEFIESEEQIKSLIFRGMIDNTLLSLVWDRRVLEHDAIYNTVLKASQSNVNSEQTRNARKMFALFEARTLSSMEG
jgi:hypothetical protein